MKLGGMVREVDACSWWEVGIIDRKACCQTRKSRTTTTVGLVVQAKLQKT